MRLFTRATCAMEKAPDDDGTRTEEIKPEGGEGRSGGWRGRCSSNVYDTNTFNVSKTFRDGRDENR